MSSGVASPYLTGHLEPVHDERDDLDLEVLGELPDALSGAYLRNGPNPAFPPLGRYHLFDGDSMVHRVVLSEGRACYRNRYVRSAGLLAEQRAGHALFGGLSEFRLPEPEVVAEVGMLKNTGNTSLVAHAGRLFALLEAAKPTELSAELDTVGDFDFGGALRGPMTAHPRIDPAAGEMLFFGYSPIPPYLRYHQVDRTGALTDSVDIDLPAPVMMHDFVITATRVVFFDLPAVFDLEAMLAGGAAVRWDPDNGARIGVLDRARLDAGARWIEVEPFWAFHFLNAHDEPDGTIVVHGCRAPRLNTVFGDDEPVGVSRPALHRWRIDPAGGTVADEVLDDHPADFPRIDDRRAGRHVRYGYVARARVWGDEVVDFDGVARHDLRTGEVVTHTYGPDALSGEAVFAPDPTRDDEDAGWLLNFVHDRATNRSSLVVVEAASMEETARVLLPRRVPFGFHGTWIPEV